MKRLLNLFLIGLLLLMCAACATEQTVSRSDFALDTVVTVTVYGEADESVLKPAFDLIREYDKKWNVFSEDSELALINRSAGIEPVKVSEDTFEIIRGSIKYSELSDGRFDISAGSLIELWGIGEPETKEKPSQTAIDAAKQNVNYKNIRLNATDHTVFLTEKGMKLNFGAVAKGFISQKIKAQLQSQGIEHALINLGGNIVLLGGKNQHEAFKIGIQDPEMPEKAPIGEISAKDTAIVVSGDYQRYFTDASGKKYHHILDAKTGYPVVSGLKLVAVMTEDALKADALSTTLLIMGKDFALDYANHEPDVECLVVTTDHQIFASDGMKSVFKFNEEKLSLGYRF